MASDYLSPSDFEKTSSRLVELLDVVRAFYRFFVLHEQEHQDIQSRRGLSPLGWSHVLDGIRLDQKQMTTIAEALSIINVCGDPDKIVRTADVTASNAHEAALRIVSHFKYFVWYAVDPCGCDQWETSNLRAMDDPPSPVSCSPDWKALVPIHWEAACAAFSMVANYDWDLLKATMLRERACVLGRLAADNGMAPPIVASDANARASGTATAGKKPSVNARMLETIQKDTDALGWNSIQRARRLRCAKSSVVETKAWKDLRMRRERLRAERALDRGRRPKGSDLNRD